MVVGIWEIVWNVVNYVVFELFEVFVYCEVVYCGG